MDPSKDFTILLYGSLGMIDKKELCLCISRWNPTY